MDEFGVMIWVEFDICVNWLIYVLCSVGFQIGDIFVILLGNWCEYFEVIVVVIYGGWWFVFVNWYWVGEEVVYVLVNFELKVLFVDVRFIDVVIDVIKSVDVLDFVLRVVIGVEVIIDFQFYEDVLVGVVDIELEDQGLGGLMFYILGMIGWFKGVVSSIIVFGGFVEFMQLIGVGILDSMFLFKDGIIFFEGLVYYFV